MKPVKTSGRWRRLGAAARATALVLAGAWVGQSLADSLADAPLFTASSTSIKPNLMFILDDSGSMQWDFMPDAADILDRRDFGRSSAQCNGLAYDPDQVYPAPYDLDGSNKVVSKGDADIAAWTKPDPTLQTREQLLVNTISTGSSIAVGNSATVTYAGSGMFFDDPMDAVTVFKDKSNYFIGQVSSVGWGASLTIRIVYVAGTIQTGTVTGYKIGKGEPVPGEYYEYTAATKQPRLSWYNADGSVNSGSTFYAECTRLVKDGSTKFTLRTVSSLASDKQQNYANWAKYYRTRIESMQSSSSVAFRNIDDRYRVGYSTIGQPSAKTGSEDFLHVDDFTPSHKKNFYTQLFAAKPSNTGTPLRGALAKAGQYFAKKAKDQDKDPVQFSCQRNFAILSTDGYWNEGGNRGNESVGNEYGPYKLDRKTLVGNVDNSLPRPMADGNTLKSVTVEKWSTITKGFYEIESGTVLVKSSKTFKTASGTVRRERRYSTSVAKLDCTGQKRREVTVTQERTIPGVREVAKITGTSTATTTVTRYDRTQQVDHVRTIVVQDGATISDSTADTPYAPTETKVSEATATKDPAPLAPGNTDTVTEGAATAWTTISGTESYSSCKSGAEADTSTPWTHASYTLTSFSAESTVALADRTEPFPTVEGWVPTPEIKDTAKLVTEEFESKNGSSNTLSDVAAYYYETDLRNSGLSNCLNDAGKDVCEDNVPGTALKDPYKSFGDGARTQHMTTFTLGMGVSGSLKYDPNYISLRSGDFHDIVNLGKNWPNTSSGKNTTVDDLWHAAVNGRGQYFSAGNPAALTAGLNTALAAIDTVIGSASAASTSSLQPVAGDNDIFVAQFTTKEWIGDVLAYKIDPNTGQIPKDITWSAQARLELADWTKRKIYYNSPGAKALKTFDESNLNGDGLAFHFDKFCSQTGAGGAAAPSQCAGLADKTEPNKVANLVDYLRGDQTKTYYRKRTKRLGDIINASPLFVGKPAFKYTENNYAKFASDNAGRTAVVLAAANDGMLHAFDRATGDELWAYIPSAVIPEMRKLADDNFMNAHQYYVDGSPQIADVYDSASSSWKTIVIGGLNKGGRGYYALDVTDPGNPKVMWEFTHKNLGYTFGNPIVTKRKDQKWVVVFASGYENGDLLGGDGNGRLFVLDALTGEELIKDGIPTLDEKGDPVGTAAKPSGLARVNSWVEEEEDNTSLRFYAGDELGNLWRFDIDGNVEPKNAALRLAQLKSKDGVAQPITTKPAVALISYNGVNYPVVYVATGSYMRTDDAKSKTFQSVYAIKDPLTATTYGDVRAGGQLQEQTITAGLDPKKNPTRTSTTEKVDWSAKAGWYADFPVGGERVSVNPQLALDTLYVGSNLPKDEDCSVGGDSFLYEFNILTGASSGMYIGNVLVQGLTLVQLTKGSSAGSIVTIITRSDGSLQTDIGAPPSVVGTLRRTSWRELVD